MARIGTRMWVGVVITALVAGAIWIRGQESFGAPVVAAPLLERAALDSLDLGSEAWTEFRPPTGEANTFTLHGSSEIEVSGTAAASIRWRVMDQPVEGELELNWRWRVEAEPEPMPLDAGGSDRPVAVMVGFASGAPPLLVRLARKLPFLPSNLPDRTLMYVWGGTHERGQTLDSPFPKVMPGYVFVLRPGGSPHGEWFEESVSIADDYRRLFGEEPTRISHLGITSDGDNTKSKCHAFVADLRLRAPVGE